MALAGWMHAAPVATDAWLRARATRAAALGALATGVVLSLGLLGMTVAPFLLASAVFALLYAPASLWAAWTRRVGLARQAHVLALPRAASLHRPLRAARDRRRRGAYRGRRGRRTRAHRGVGDLARVVRRRLPAAGATHRVARRRRRASPSPAPSWRSSSSRRSSPCAMRRRARCGDGVSVPAWNPTTPSAGGSGRRRGRACDGSTTTTSSAPTRSGFPVRTARRSAPRACSGCWSPAMRSAAPRASTPTSRGRGSSSPRCRTRTDGRLVEVLNFAVTGYGPNQEAAVVAAVRAALPARRRRGRVFVNDFDDALTSDEAFRASIGFGRRRSRTAGRRARRCRTLLDLVKVELLAAALRPADRDAGESAATPSATSRRWSAIAPSSRRDAG